MRSLLRYLKPYRLRIVVGLSVKFIGTMMDLVLPWLLATLVDTALPAGDRAGVWRYGALMALCALVAVTFNVGANRMAAATARDFTRTLRHDLFARILSLPAAARDRYAAPTLVSRLTSDTYHVHHLVDKGLRLGVRAPLLVLGGMIFAFALSPTLSLALVGIAPLLGLVVRQVTRRGVPLYGAAQRRVDALVRAVRENAVGVRVIRALSKSGYEKERFAQANAAACESELKAGKVMAVTQPVMTLLLNTGFMLVLLAGAALVDAGRVQPGVIMGLLQYFTIILTAVLAINKMFMIWSRGSASAQRIEEVLRLPGGLPGRPAAPVKTEAFLSFSHVSFSYNGRTDQLHDISFTLGRGRTLGVIGPTGSGKSTLAALLLRLYDPDEGEIRVGGMLAGSVEGALWKGMFGTVFQNDVLLADTVYENISFLRGLPREDVARAARAAQIAQFIETLPEGYDAPLSIRGANLSGGQRQRILIARALAGAPAVLVLDDAASALDYRTDAALRRAIRREYPDTTVVLISQRVSAVRNADWILVLDEGRAVGAGTHRQLLRDCPAYRESARIQMGGA